MALNLNKNIIGTCLLVEMTWANGSVYRYSTASGDIVWSGQTWKAHTDTQGVITTLPNISEGGDIASNIDIGLSYTNTIRDLCLNQYHNQMLCKIYNAEIDPDTAALQVETTFTEWVCQSFKITGNQSINLVFGDKLTYLMQKSVAWKTNTEHQKILAGSDLTDIAFDKVSGANSANIATQAQTQANQQGSEAQMRARGLFF